MSTESTKTMKGRISNKHGTEEYWILSVYTDLTKNTLRENPFIPLDGELIIYDPDSVYTCRRIKIGDGETYVTDLPFVTDPYQTKTDNALETESKEIVGAINELFSALEDSQGDLVGTWTFNDTINFPQMEVDESKEYAVDYLAQGNDGVTYRFDTLCMTRYREDGFVLHYYNYSDDVYFEDVYDAGWNDEHYPTITVTKDPTDTECIEWIKANAVKISGASGIGQLSDKQNKVDYNLNTESKEIVSAINELNNKTLDQLETLGIGSPAEDFEWDDCGVSWSSPLSIYNDNDELVKSARIHNNLPFVAGRNIGFDYDPETGLIKVNAADLDIVGTWIFNDYLAETSFGVPLKFESNGTMFYQMWANNNDWLQLSYGEDTYFGSSENSILVYDDSWGELEAYKTITILEGSTNTEFVAWLKANAVKQENTGAINPSEGLEYILSDDETYYICSGLGDCTDTIVSIPSEYNGLPVKEIGPWAFHGDYVHSQVTQIIVPNSVNIIREYAFASSDGEPYWESVLTKVVLPENNCTIEGGAFAGCVALTEVELPKDLLQISYALFSSCISLTNIKIPKTVETIEYDAFWACDNIASIIIPKSVKTISGSIFPSRNSSDPTLVIYCEASEKPDGWDTSWNEGYLAVDFDEESGGAIPAVWDVVWGFASDFETVSEKIAEINNTLGDISIILDDLHGYAQNIIGGTE